MQIIVNGIITGTTISLLALAFSVVFLPTGIFHIAMGGIYAAVPFITLTFLNWGWSWYIAVTAGIFAGVALSLACELFNHARLRSIGASSAAQLVSSLGIYIIIVQVIALTWGSETKVLRTGVDKVLMMGNISITWAQAISGVVSILVILLYYFWLRYSNLGLQFRALSDNPVEFALRGYNVRGLWLLIFGISGMLCSICSLLVSFDMGFDPQGGFIAVLLAVVAVIIGGRESFMGPVLGGILLGIVRSEVVWFLSARWQDAVTFLLFVLFLLFQPNGILARKGRLEASL